MNIEEEIKQLELKYKNDREVLKDIEALKANIKCIEKKQKDPAYKGQTSEQFFDFEKGVIEYWNPVGDGKNTVKKQITDNKTIDYKAKISKDGTKYFLEDSVYPKSRERVIRQPKDKLIQRYDWDSEKWIDDVEMLQIYFGEIEVDNITEEEAFKYIKDHK